MDGIMRVSAIAMAVLMLLTGSIILTDDSDAYTSTYTLEFETGQQIDQDLTSVTDRSVLFLYSGSLPEGLELDIRAVGHEWYGNVYRTYLIGTILASPGTYTFTLSDDSSFYEFRTLVTAGECTVTYDAGLGLVKGDQTWSETITKGTFASLPSATHSSGAYTFLGWAVSAISVHVLESYAATGDITLHAVWKRNTVQISDSTATVTSGQSASLPLVTDPQDAVITVTGSGGLPIDNISIIGNELLIDATDAAPGTYYITLSAAYTGYISGESVVTVRVPITIVKPIEYVLSQGDSFSYTPVTNPTNANITLTSVTLDGNVLGNMGGLSVNGRSIVGDLDRIGTYAITYTASLDGYVDVTNTVFVKVNERPASAPAPVMGTITATPRANEPRVYDFVLSGYSNASNVIWSYEGRVFATSSPTALFEFPASGSYTITCTLAGFDGSFVSEDVDVICLDNYHREAAWAGIQYSYVIEGDAEISIENGAPFSVIADEVNGKQYSTIAGIPSEANIGESFDVHVGDDSWSITVYRAETSAPVADFDLVLSDDGYTVVAVFKGQNASFYTYDFDGDGISESGNAFTYVSEGRYTVVCRAANNVSEVSKSDMVAINVVPHEDVDILDLTDFQMVAGERLDIVLTLQNGDAVTVSGSASGFIQIADGVLKVGPSEKGVYDLTVSIHHGNGTISSKTVKVTVRGTDIQELEDEKHDYMVVMAVFFIISVTAIAVFILRDVRSASVNYGQNMSLLDRIRRRRMYR